MGFQMGPNMRRNIAVAIFAVLTANTIPVTANLLRPILNTVVPIPLIENVGGIVGMVGIVALWWLWDKDL